MIVKEHPVVPVNVVTEVTMAKREFTNKGGETWTWEETEETVKALKAYHALVAKNKQNEVSQ